MAIKFLTAHEVANLSFAAGEVVKDRDEASELHFVRRGLAAYLDQKTGKLTDHDGNAVVDPFPPAAKSAADAGDGLDKLSGTKLKSVVDKEKVTIVDGADDAAIRTAIRAHRQAALSAADGLDDLTDEQVTEKVTTTGVTVAPGADRAAMLAALREHARLAANGS